MLQHCHCQWGKSSLCISRPRRNTTVMGPQRAFRAGREILREDRKKAKQEFDSSNSLLDTQQREKHPP